MNTIKKILKPLASLYLTVALLALSMLLVYAGTTVQKHLGIQDVQKQYFHSWFAWVQFDSVLRPFAAANDVAIPGGFWTVGGYSLLGLLLVNLLAAHSVRFKFTRKRIGIILIHLGLILLLVGEIFTSLFAVESQMVIDQGQTVNSSFDTRHVELAITDTSRPDHNDVTIVNESALKSGAVIKPPTLPFEVRLDDFYPNAAILGPVQQVQGAVQKATAGENKPLKLLPESKVSGTQADQVDQPGAFVTLRSGNQDLGTYLVSAGLLRPEHVRVDGKTYEIELRFRRYYKPYTITLLKFSFDRYAGTNLASNYSSRVRLVDPSRNVDREVVIWMNHPLTYRGETFYQQSFKPNETTTQLQVTHNPTWIMPYVGLGVGFVGMLVHFGMHLFVFLRRTLSTSSAPAPVPARGKQPARGGRGGSYTLQPRRNRLAWTAGIGATLATVAVVAHSFLSPGVQENGFDLGTFGQLPVEYGGRVMPLDSLARIGLKIVSGRETYKDADGVTHPAIRWLADGIGEVSGANDAKVIRIDYPDILTQFGLDPDKKYFSLNDLLAHKEAIQKQMDMAIQVPEKQRDLYQKRMAELAQHVETYLEVQQPFHLALVPPAKGKIDWQPMVSPTGTPTPGAEQIATIFQAYHEQQPHEFNTLVQKYHDQLEHDLPKVMASVDFEALFDHVGPFFLCLILYFFVFVLACVSWLGAFRKPLWAAALGVLLVTLVVHTFGLAGRVYITGRGPVTNLYSSAIFIAWAAVLFAIGLEIIFRNGLGAAVAAIMGFASLLIAHYLGVDSDTMSPVQAVLATNFWLWTHVPCVTLGYAATFLAGGLGALWVLLQPGVSLYERTSGTSAAEWRALANAALARMVYGILCFAILFSFVGTILGGIWADYSWGRFWGWDPKENGAILIVIWNAIILHARWAGLVRQRGMMVLALVGNIVTAWSWFGTNLLGIGLHSYGFMEGATDWLKAWWGLQLALIVVGLLPQTLWKPEGAGERAGAARSSAGAKPGGLAPSRG